MSRSLKANGSINSLSLKIRLIRLIRVPLLLNREELFEETAEGTFFVDEVDLEDPVAGIPLDVEFGEFDGIVGMKIIMYFIAENMFVREIADEMSAVDVAELPTVFAGE